jgi:sn-glycerol 3-phosphate transport system substrate-binding protein
MRGKRIVAALLTGLMLLAGSNVMAKKIEIQWWHAMRSARGEVCKALIDKFNESQDKYVVVGTNKGNYDEVLNAGIAAIRAQTSTYPPEFRGRYPDHDAFRSHLSDVQAHG